MPVRVEEEDRVVLDGLDEQPERLLTDGLDRVWSSRCGIWFGGHVPDVPGNGLRVYAAGWSAVAADTERAE